MTRGYRREGIDARVSTRGPSELIGSGSCGFSGSFWSHQTVTPPMPGVDATRMLEQCVAKRMRRGGWAMAHGVARWTGDAETIRH